MCNGETTESGAGAAGGGGGDRGGGGNDGTGSGGVWFGEPPTDGGVRARIAHHYARMLVMGEQHPYYVGQRYPIVDVDGDRGFLGEGGMGLVYRVRHEHLQRVCVAKFTKSPLNDESLAQIRAEAVLLGDLQHRNIVAVHDTGFDQDDFFIILEYVTGENLDRWIKEGRPLARVLDVFIQAGEGLGAAHARSIVHRDFKPENVRVSPDGERWRVRVLDFGIAGRLRESTLVGASTSLTAQTRGRMGTPGYISPEVLAGRPATPQSDQFSFCVSLYEALFGQRPFGALTDAAARATYEAKTEAGALIEPRFSSAAHQRLYRRVLRRGLAPRPEARFPTMDALVEALVNERERPAQRRRNLKVGTMAGLSVALGVAIALSIPPDPTPHQICQETRTAIEDMWTDEARAEVDAALVRLRAPRHLYLERLNGYASAWRDAQRELCVDVAHLPPSADEDTRRRFGAVRACLDRRLGVFVNVVDALRSANASSVDLSLLPDPSRVRACVLHPSLDEGLETPIAQAAEQALITSESELILGHYDTSREFAEEALALARQIPEGPLLARALYQVARAQTYGEDAPDARGLLEHAALLADRWQMVDLAADVALRQLRIAARYGERTAAAIHFQSLLGRLAWLREVGGSREYDARLLLAQLDLQSSDHAAARAQLRAIELSYAMRTPWERARLHTVRSKILLHEDRGASRGELQKALLLQEEELAPAHPAVIQALVELALAERHQGDYAAADAALQVAEGLASSISPAQETFLSYARMELEFAQNNLSRAQAVAERLLARDLIDPVPLALRDEELSVYGRLLAIYYEKDLIYDALHMCELLLERFGDADSKRIGNYDVHFRNALAIAEQHAEDLGYVTLVDRLRAAQVSVR